MSTHPIHLPFLHPHLPILPSTYYCQFSCSLTPPSLHPSTHPVIHIVTQLSHRPTLLFVPLPSTHLIMSFHKFPGLQLSFLPTHQSSLVLAFTHAPSNLTAYLLSSICPLNSSFVHLFAYCGFPVCLPTRPLAHPTTQIFSPSPGESKGMQTWHLLLRSKLTIY